MLLEVMKGSGPDIIPPTASTQHGELKEAKVLPVVVNNVVNTNHVTNTVASALELDAALKCIISQVGKLLNVETAALFLMEPETGNLILRAALDHDIVPVEPSRIAKEQAVAGQVVLTGDPVVMANGAESTRNLLCVPLIMDDQVIGVLEVKNKMQGSLNQNDLDLLKTMASYAALTIENVCLRKTVLAERNRVIEVEKQVRKEVAADLHDGPLQLVSTMLMQLEFCRQVLKKDPPLLAEQFMGMYKLGQQAIDQMRTMLFELRPLILETEGLVAALQVFLQRRQQETKTSKLALIVKSHRPGGQLLRQEGKVEATLFAIIQEAVNNALKHAQAHNIAVHLNETPSAICTEVMDDGQGFEVDKIRQGYERQHSLGLLNIQERVAWIGGELTIKSAPGQGTHIAVCVPTVKEEQKTMDVCHGDEVTFVTSAI